MKIKRRKIEKLNATRDIKQILNFEINQYFLFDNKFY